MKYKIFWNKSAERSLSDILDYIIENDTIENAYKIYKKIKEGAELLKVSPKQGRAVPELKVLGDKYREIIIKPWRILYTLEHDLVKVLLVIDGRRDLEEILFERMIKIDNP